jgi:predicted GNAT family N-acyltransferase
MSPTVTYQEMQSGEEVAVSELVMKVFNEFVAPGYSVEGINTFKNYAIPSCILQRQVGGNLILTAKDAEQIVGIIEIRDIYHISLLFVEKSYHQQGIAKQLINKALIKCKATNPPLHKFTVNSSPYAVLIYKKIGFKSTAPEQVKNGIRYVPMTLNL